MFIYNMVPFKTYLHDWKKVLLESDSGGNIEPASLRVLDFDHTVAYTPEMVMIKSPEGEIVDRLDSHRFATHELSRNEIAAGYSYDFSEFDDVNEKETRENDHVVRILSNFINAPDPDSRIILILTARNQEAESGIRRFFETVGIPHDRIMVIGVGSSLPQKKVDEVEKILDENPSIDRVSFYDDSYKNVSQMVKFIKAYNTREKRSIDYDIALVNPKGKLVRPKGFRS